jgi:hypothetical protein
MNAAMKSRPDWRLVLLVWIVSALVLAWRLASDPGARPLFNDTDDAMRMVVVRDLLAGQGWTDIVQHRLNTPFGADLHWSRLVDAGQAGLLLILRPLLGAGAETALGYLWPALLLLPLVWLGGALAMRLCGPAGQLPGLVLAVLSPVVTHEFLPGRLDHHNLQILLALALALTTLNALDHRRWAIGAGVIAATGLAIGVEALPLIVAAIAGLGLAYVLDGQKGRALARFGTSFAAASALHLALALPPDRWLQPACDMLSLVYVTAGLLLAAGTGLLGLPALVDRGWPVRLGAGALLGLIAVGAMLVLFPDCRRGPYAMIDPWLMTNWIDRITEAKPLVNSLAAFPAYVLSSAVPVALALLGTLVMALRNRGDARRDWLVYGLMLVVATAVMLLQIRAARLAVPMAAAGGAGLIVAARALYLGPGRRRIWAALPLIIAWLGSAGIAVSMATNALTPRPAVTAGPPAPSKIPCLMPAAFVDLRALPPSRILTPVDLGAHMLLETPHSVVAAPYHRNQQGVRDAFTVLNGAPDEALAILDARGISLVVTCPAMNEMRGLADADPQSLVRQLAAGTTPGWLIDQSLAGAPLKIYAVVPASARTPVPMGQETPVPASPQ